MSSVTSQSSRHALDDYLSPFLRKSLIEIHNASQAGKAITIATIQKIQTNYNWCYDACNQCTRKLQFNDQNILWCKGCEKIPEKIRQSFFTHVLVSDESGTAVFVLFDKDCFKILKRTATELKDQLKKNGNEYGFPEELNALINRKFAFVIQISHEFNILKKKNSYTVLKMTEDVDKIIDSSSDSAIREESSKEVQTGFITDIAQSVLPLAFVTPVGAESSMGEQSSFASESIQSRMPLTSSPRTPRQVVSIISDNDIEVSSSDLATPKRNQNNADISSPAITDLLTPKYSATKPFKRVKIEPKDPEK